MSNVPGPVRAGAAGAGKPKALWPAATVARCEGCGLGFSLDDLRRLVADPVGADGDEPVFSCGECGSPVYAVDPAEVAEVDDVDLAGLIEDCPRCVAAVGECGFHRGFGAGWDAAVAAMSGWVEDGGLVELGGLRPGEAGEVG